MLARAVIFHEGSGHQTMVILVQCMDYCEQAQRRGMCTLVYSLRTLRN